MAMILWPEFEGIGSWGLRATTGTRILVRLSKDDIKALLHAIYQEWRLRQPEAYRRHRERCHRVFRMGLTVLLPSLVILLDLFCSLYYWWLGRPTIPEQIRWPMIRVQVGFLVLCVLSWAMYLFLRRSVERSEKSEIENQQKTSEVSETSEV